MDTDKHWQIDLLRAAQTQANLYSAKGNDDAALRVLRMAVHQVLRVDGWASKRTYEAAVDPCDN